LTKTEFRRQINQIQQMKTIGTTCS
jgi:hypothetical protein